MTSLLTAVFFVFVELEVDELWYPKQKIEVARRKLHGDNCAHIMRYVIQQLDLITDLFAYLLGYGPELNNYIFLIITKYSLT